MVEGGKKIVYLWRVGLKERKEEKKLLYKGWRFRKLSDKRLVSLVVEKLKEVGDVGWREDFELLLRKYGLEKEGRGSAAAWRSQLQREEENWEDWCEEKKIV